MSEEYSDEEVLAALGQKPAPTESSWKDNILVKYGLTPLNEIAGTIVEPALQMGAGYLGSFAGNIGGAAAATKDYLTGNTEGDPAGFKQYIQDSLSYEPKTKGGQFVSNNILAPIGGAIDSAAGAVGSKVEDVTGSSVLGSGAKEATLQGVGLIGAGGGKGASSTIKQSNLAKFNALKNQKSLDAIRNSIKKAGNDIGLIAPAESGLKIAASRIGGAEPHVSLKNMEVATNVLAKDIGLGKGAISDADIVARVSALSQKYKDVENALPANVPINSNFLSEVNSLLLPMKERITQDPKAFAGYSGAIDLLEQQLKQQTIPPAILMDKIQKLRSDARIYDKNPSGKPIEVDLAATSYKLANVYEDLIESSLGKNSDTLAKFRDARKQLSQLHIIDSARKTDGLIDLQKLSSIVGKYGADKKMTSGNLKTVADFANTYKSVTKPVEKSNFSSPSRWEVGMALGGVAGAPATGGGSLAFAAPLVTRAIAPVAAEKGLLQSSIPSYELSAFRKGAPLAAQSGMLGGGLTPYSAQQQPAVIKAQVQSMTPEQESQYTDDEIMQFLNSQGQQ